MIRFRSLQFESRTHLTRLTQELSAARAECDRLSAALDTARSEFDSQSTQLLALRRELSAAQHQMMQYQLALASAAASASASVQSVVAPAPLPLGVPLALPVQAWGSVPLRPTTSAAPSAAASSGTAPTFPALSSVDGLNAAISNSSGGGAGSNKAVDDELRVLEAEYVL